MHQEKTTTTRFRPDQRDEGRPYVHKDMKMVQQTRPRRMRVLLYEEASCRRGEGINGSDDSCTLNINHYRFSAPSSLGCTKGVVFLVSLDRSFMPFLITLFIKIISFFYILNIACRHASLPAHNMTTK